jgi:hypothetical protein
MRALSLHHEQIDVTVTVDVATGDVPPVSEALPERGLAVAAVVVQVDQEILPTDTDEVRLVVTIEVAELHRAVVPRPKSKAFVVLHELATLVAENHETLLLGANREVDMSVAIDVG